MSAPDNIFDNCTIGDAAVTVRELLDAGVIGARLAGGASGLERTIRRVNIYADAEILDWVSPGEILLLTEKNTEEWSRERWKEFLEKCRDRELAAVCVKYQEEGKEAPSWLRKTADRLELPLLLLPADLSIAEVSSAIFRMIFARQCDILERQRKLNESLQSLLLDRSGLDSVLELLRRSLSLPVYFHAVDYREPILLSDESEIAEESFVTDASAILERGHHSPRAYAEETRLEGRPAWRFSVPVRSTERHYGTLFTWSFSRREESFILSTLEAVAATLALLIMQEYALREVEIRHSSEFIETLLSDRIDPALDRAAVFKLDINDSYAVAIIRLGLQSEDQDLPLDPHFFILANMHWLHASLQAHGIHGMIARHGACLELVIAKKGETDEAKIRERIRSFIEEMASTLSARTGNREFSYRAGVSRFHSGLQRLGRAWHEAQDTLRVGQTLFGRDLIFYDELGIFRVLIRSEVSDDMRVLKEETLGPLLRYDARKGTDFVHTLEVYLQQNCNINKTSEALFAHYNTVLYRLERIREITGLDLSDPNNRLNLEVSLKMRRVFACEDEEKKADPPDSGTASALK